MITLICIITLWYILVTVSTFNTTKTRDYPSYPSFNLALLLFSIIWPITLCIQGGIDLVYWCLRKT
jgi:hypothetical protein